MTALFLGAALCIIGALTEIDGIRKLNRATDMFHRASETYNRAAETFTHAAALNGQRFEQALRNKTRGVS